jgi:hypothetical protein
LALQQQLQEIDQPRLEVLALLVPNNTTFLTIKRSFRHCRFRLVVLRFPCSGWFGYKFC